MDRDAKRKHENLEMVWIDNKKAYDTVPHGWIIASHENIKAHSSIVAFMKRTMTLWRSELRLEVESYGHCQINCGIFQGDSARIFSTDIGMTFGIDKCPRLGTRRTKLVLRDGIKLPYGQQIKNLDDDDHHRYLGMLIKKEDINHQKVKNSVQIEYKRRLGLILKSKLSGKVVRKKQDVRH